MIQEHIVKYVKRTLLKLILNLLTLLQYCDKELYLRRALISIFKGELVLLIFEYSESEISRT